MKFVMITTTFFALFLLSTSVTAVTITDTDGNPLRNGGTYYILPVFRGMGGGIGITITGNETNADFQRTVVQSPSEVSLGLPIKFSSPAKIAIIGESLALEIAFDDIISAPPVPPQWTIVKGLPEGWAVKLGYEDTVQGSFFIKKYILDYKLVFCSLSTGVCADIGIYIDSDGKRRLVLTEEKPFIVQFKIATSSAA